jgi:hypothetical protein
MFLLVVRVSITLQYVLIKLTDIHETCNRRHATGGYSLSCFSTAYNQRGVRSSEVESTT